jgi:hypothetical protein
MRFSGKWVFGFCRREMEVVNVRLTKWKNLGRRRRRTTTRLGWYKSPCRHGFCERIREESKAAMCSCTHN